MLTAQQTSWDVLNWAKPFGESSNDREWNISTGGRPRKKTRCKKYASDDDKRRFFRSRNLRPREGKLEPGQAFVVQPTVRVKAYAHDRIVFTVFDQYPCQPARAPAGPSVGEIIAGGGSLDRCRETRRGFKIGGRWRFRPSYNSFTSSARNTVKDAAHIIEHYSEGECVFLTLTMAGGTRKAYACMGAASGYIVDRMNRWLRYKVQNGFFTYVWELQQRGAPHIHYLFRVPNGTNVADFGRLVQSQWRKILLDVSAESGVDVFARLNGGTWLSDSNYPIVDTRPVSYTLSSYLAKYVSKERTKGGIRSPFRPGRWWGVSYAVREEIKKRRLDIYFPVRTLLEGISVAETLIAECKTLVEKSQWANFPPHIVLESCSIFVVPGAAFDVVKSLVSFVGSGDFSAWCRSLRALNLRINTT